MCRSSHRSRPFRNCLIRSYNTKLSIRIKLTHFFPVKILCRIKVFYFARKLSFEFSGIETSNRGSATNAGNKIIPIIHNIITKWGYCT